MSSTPAVNAQDSSDGSAPARAAAPWKNPSYPARTHWAERPALEEKLRSWERKVEERARKLAVLGSGESRASYERIYHQMMGALDQMSESVRRMPREAGALYHEDLERLQNAEAALTRLFRDWEAARS